MHIIPIEIISKNFQAFFQLTKSSNLKILYHPFELILQWQSFDPIIDLSLQ